MHEMDTVARREDPAKPTSGLDAKRVSRPKPSMIFGNEQ
jgi:hypothetical protein